MKKLAILFILIFTTNPIIFGQDGDKGNTKKNMKPTLTFLKHIKESWPSYKLKSAHCLNNKLK